MYDLCMGDNMRLDVCDALEYTDHGWEVYTTERGGKYDVRVFDNETSACLELLWRMIDECIFEKRTAITIYQAPVLPVSSNVNVFFTPAQHSASFAGLPLRAAVQCRPVPRER